MMRGMTINVEFPDGARRDMPSELRIDGASGAFHHVPLESSARWRFVAGESGWRAVPRHGGLAVLTPPVEEWWRGIAAMTDDPSCSDDAAQPTRAA